MNREIKRIRQRLEYLEELKLEIECYTREIADSLNKLEKELNGRQKR